MRGKAKGSRGLSKMLFVEIEKNNFLLTFFSEFRNLKFPELESWELEVPGTWELLNLGTCLRVSPFLRLVLYWARIVDGGPT